METAKETAPEKTSIMSRIGRFFGGGGSKEKLEKQSPSIINNNKPVPA